jgi:hypothetical protein
MNSHSNLRLCTHRSCCQSIKFIRYFIITSQNYFFFNYFFLNLAPFVEFQRTKKPFGESFCLFFPRSNDVTFMPTLCQHQPQHVGECKKEQNSKKQIFIYLFECFYFSFVLSGGGSMLIDSCTVAGVKAF